MGGVGINLSPVNLFVRDTGLIATETKYIVNPQSEKPDVVLRVSIGSEVLKQNRCFIS